MITIKKSTLRKAGFGFAALLLLALLAIGFAPREVSFANGATCGDGVCDPTSENSDLCDADCECVDNGVADPGEGLNCKDVVGDSEELSSACGTPAGSAGECPSKLQDDGTTKSLSEFNGVCWDACECEGLCTEEEVAAEVEKAKKSAVCGQEQGRVATEADALAAIAVSKAACTGGTFPGCTPDVGVVTLEFYRFMSTDWLWAVTCSK